MTQPLNNVYIAHHMKISPLKRYMNTIIFRGETFCRPLGLVCFLHDIRFLHPIVSYCSSTSLLLKFGFLSLKTVFFKTLKVVSRYNETWWKIIVHTKMNLFITRILWNMDDMYICSFRFSFLGCKKNHLK